MHAELPNVIRAVIRASEADRRLREATQGTRTANRELGEALRFYREQRGISLRSIAKHLKCSAPYVSDCELGRRTFSDKHREAYLDFLQPGRNLKIR